MSIGRRDAMGKVFAGLAGAAGVLSGANSAPSPSRVKMLHMGPSDPQNGYASVPSAPDPMDMARYRAAEKVERKIEALYGRGDNPTMQQFSNNNYVENCYDVMACKSTSHWFKQHVMHERAKARESVVKTLREEVQKIMRSPLDGLEASAREAVLGFLAEIQK